MGGGLLQVFPDLGGEVDSNISSGGDQTTTVGLPRSYFFRSCIPVGNHSDRGHVTNRYQIVDGIEAAPTQSVDMFLLSLSLDVSKARHSSHQPHQGQALATATRKGTVYLTVRDRVALSGPIVTRCIVSLPHIKAWRTHLRTFTGFWISGLTSVFFIIIAIRSLLLWRDTLAFVKLSQDPPPRPTQDVGHGAQGVRRGMPREIFCAFSKSWGSP